MSEEVQTEYVDSKVESTGRVLYTLATLRHHDPADVSLALCIALSRNACMNARKDSDKETVKHDIMRDFGFMMDQMWEMPHYLETRNSDERDT